MTLFPRTVELIHEKTDRDILFIGGGIVPSKDMPKLEAAGIPKIFGPGSSVPEIVQFIQNKLGEGSNDNQN